MRSFVRSLVFLVFLASSSSAFADESGLRNGFSLAAGQEFGGDRDVSATLFGLDWRIGWRINEPISFYLDSHVSFGSGKEGGGNSGLTGTVTSAVIGEYKLPFGLFVGGGAGWYIANAPNGPMVQARAGFYPFKAEGPGKKRRLNVAVDYRVGFINQGYGSINFIALSLGYDRF